MAKTFIEHAPSLAERMVAQWRRDLFITMEIYRKKRYPCWESFYLHYFKEIGEERDDHQYLSGVVVHNYLRKKYLELEIAEQRFAFDYHSVIHREAIRGQ